MRVAFYAPLKAPDHPVPSGDRAIARLLLAALERAGATRGWEVDVASRLRSFDGAGDADRQARLREIGARIADRLLHRYREAPAGRRPDLWFTYHLYHKAPDWIGPVVSERLGIPIWWRRPRTRRNSAEGGGASDTRRRRRPFGTRTQSSCSIATIWRGCGRSRGTGRGSSCFPPSSVPGGSFRTRAGPTGNRCGWTARDLRVGPAVPAIGHRRGARRIGPDRRAGGGLAPLRGSG